MSEIWNAHLPGFELDRNALADKLHHEFARSLDSVELQIALDEGINKTLEAMTTHAIENQYGYSLMACRSVAIKMLRRKKKEASLLELTLEPHAEDGSERKMIAQDLVRNIFKRMIPAWCEVLKLGNEGFSVEEIAVKMGKTKKAVYHLKERAEARFYELGIKLGMPAPPSLKQESHQGTKK